MVREPHNEKIIKKNSSLLNFNVLCAILIKQNTN